MSDHTPAIWFDVLAILMGMIAVAFTSWLAILACGGCLLAADQIERWGLMSMRKGPGTKPHW
jgi:hypothetical protein